MIWADRVALVLCLPVVLLALVQGSSGGGAPSWQFVAIIVGAIWLLLRGLDFIATGSIRRLSQRP